MSSDGKEHKLYADGRGIGSINSELLRGAPYDEELEEYASFWNDLMQEDPVYIGLHRGNEKIRDYMDEAVMKTGFFTVKMGGLKQHHYYSATKYTSTIQSKERYGKRYENITKSGLMFREYEPGSIFKAGGKEYSLKENHTLDIPYGEDIFTGFKRL